MKKLNFLKISIVLISLLFFVYVFFIARTPVYSLVTEQPSGLSAYELTDGSTYECFITVDGKLYDMYSIPRIDMELDGTLIPIPPGEENPAKSRTCKNCIN